MTHILKTKELSQYLKLHEITICERASEGLSQLIGSVFEHLENL